jgi:hypothetical protein
MNPQDKKEWMKGLALLTWVSWEVIAWSGLGTGLGYFAARALGAPTWISLLTGLAGLALAFWRIYKASTKLGGD